MFAIRNELLAVIVLTLTQSLSHGIVHNENEEPTDSIKVAARYLLLPWIEGFDWLENSPESLEKTEISKLIRGSESGEPWAMRILEMLKNESQSQQTYIQHSDMYNKYSLAKSDKNIDISDRRCIVSVDSGSGQSTFNISAERSQSYSTDYAASASQKSQDDQIKNDLAQVTRARSSKFTTVEMSTIVFFSAIGVFLLGSTICDFVRRKKPESSSTAVNTLAKFSLYTSVVSLVKMEKGSETMTAIHGLRSLSCWSVLNGHRYIATSIVLSHKLNVLDMLKLSISVYGLCLKMKLYSVDSFCVISGFLTAHTYFKAQKSGIKTTWLTMYIRRYLRVAPCVAACILVVVVFCHRWGDGPLWEDTATKSADVCRQNWWVNLLFLQNIVRADRMCLAYTWYLALDMQLFWLSPLILYPLHRWPKFGMRMLSFFLVVSVLVPPIILTVNGYANNFIRFDSSFPSLLDNFGRFYVPTYTRAVPHLLGILVGYDVVTKRRNLTQTNLALIWTFIGSLAIFFTWGLYRICATSFAYDLTWQIVMSTLLRPSWSIIIAWIIYASTQGYGGFATRFLSLPIFLPISRLSFSIYMVHLLIQTVTISASQTFTPFSSTDLLTGHILDLVYTIPTALLLNLFIERPIIIASNILLANRGESKEEKKNSKLEIKEE